MNLLRRVLSRSRNAGQLDTGRIGERLPSVCEMEKIARHQSDLLLSLPQHSKTTCLDARDADLFVVEGSEHSTENSVRRLAK